MKDSEANINKNQPYQALNPKDTKQHENELLTRHGEVPFSSFLFAQPPSYDPHN